MKTVFLAVLILSGIALAASQFFPDPSLFQRAQCAQFIQNSSQPCAEMLVSIMLALARSP